MDHMERPGLTVCCSLVKVQVEGWKAIHHDSSGNLI